MWQRRRGMPLRDLAKTYALQMRWDNNNRIGEFMCNTANPKRPIPKTGKGWKWFFQHPSGKLHPWILGSDATYPIGKWIKWSSIGNFRNEGFCFFMTKRTALKYRSGSKYDVLLPIQYRKGLGRAKGIGAICKEFKIIKEKI